MQVEKIIEALIFAADSPMKPAQILDIFQNEEFFGINFDEQIIDDALLALLEKYKQDDFVFELRQIDGGYQFFTKKDYYPFVKHAVLNKSTRRMSRASLETLSLVAYRQPVTKPDIEYIRGVNCDYAIRKLLDKNLIEIRGRSDLPGRPLLYGTTPFFMEYFGLNSLSDMPKLSEVHSEEKEFQAQFKVYIGDEDDDEDTIDTAGLEPEGAILAPQIIDSEEE